MAAKLTTQQLMDAGVHFGHLTRKWNPKMAEYIFMENNGIHLIDLNKTVKMLEDATNSMKGIVRSGRKILFVATKKQAKDIISEEASRLNMPYVTERWLGGMLTNFPTVYKRIQRLKELEAMEASNDQVRTKKELLVLRREREKLTKNLDGIRNMTKVPAAIWVVDTKKEHLAVQEAHKLGIPVVAILDTNCDPDEVDYKIPGNDDAIRSIALLTRVIADAVAAGLQARSANAHADKTEKSEVVADANLESELLVKSAAEGE